MASRSSIPLLEPSGKHQTISQLSLWSFIWNFSWQVMY